MAQKEPQVYSDQRAKLARAGRAARAVGLRVDGLDKLELDRAGLTELADIEAALVAAWERIRVATKALPERCEDDPLPSLDDVMYAGAQAGLALTLAQLAEKRLNGLE